MKGELVMADRECGGFLGGLYGGDCTILFFILVFLLLFYGWGGYGFGCKE